MQQVSLLDRLLAEKGEAFYLNVRDCLALHDFDHLYWIESGQMDLFAIQTTTTSIAPITISDIQGPRSYLSHFEIGSLLPSFPLIESKNYRVYALPNSPLIIRKIPIKDWIEITSNSVLKGEFDAKLSDYFHHFENLFTHFSFENAHVQIELEKVVMASEKDILNISRTLYPQLEPNLLWVKILKGTVELFGQSWLHLSPEDGYYPFSYNTWIRCISKTNLQALTCEEISYSHPETWKGLYLFNTHILTILSNLNQQAAYEQATKIQQREKLDQKRFQVAQEELKTVLSDEETLHSESRHDVLVNTCQIIGNQLELKFIPLPQKKIPEGIFNYVYELCVHSNICYREIRFSGDWWKCDSGPLLGFYEEDNQPIALIPHEGRYFIVDSVKGTKTKIDTETNALLSSDGFMFYRALPQKDKISSKDLLKYSSFKTLGIYSTIILFGLFTGCLNLFYPFFTNILFEYVIPHSDRTLLKQVVIGMLEIAISTQLFIFGRDYTILRLEARCDHDIASGIWQRLLNLPTQFFRRFELGDLIIRVFSINTIRQRLTGTALRVLLNSFFSLLYLIPMFYYSYVLAIIGSTFVFFITLFNTWSVLGSLHLNKSILEAKGKANGLVMQQLSAISKIRTAGAEKISFVNWERIFLPMKKLEWKMQKLSISSHVANYTLSSLSTFLIFGSVLFLMQKQATLPLTVGNFLAFLAAFTPFTLAVSNLSNTLIEISPLLTLWERGKVVLEEPLESNEEKTDPEAFTGAVNIDHISFRYDPTTPLILDDISIHAKPGEFIGIIGPSGCGKSSLVKLLIGFEKPESGAIYYDGKELSTLDIRKVRRQLGIVLQSGSLLDGTIRDNLTTKGSYSDEEIHRVLKLSGFDEDLKRLPMGLHTILMDGGNTLSGGQKQRLLIARALISKPKILILDEATSALDNKTQEIVGQNLMHLNVTRIVIAHRLSTVRYADRIYVINKGKIEDVGTYIELSKRSGTFAEFLKFQNPSLRDG